MRTLYPNLLFFPFRAGGRVMQVSIDTLYSTLDLSHIPDFILNLYVFISLQRTKLYPVQQEEWKEQQIWIQCSHN
jgi:hypothetical protein